LLFPQTAGQVPQSEGQFVHVSGETHLPSPQTLQAPQSTGQVEQVSLGPTHVPSPQTIGHVPQSAGQVEQVSEDWQRPSPHLGGQAPQSFEQFVQVSG
jgi:hypothetical protein